MLSFMFYAVQLICTAVELFLKKHEYLNPGDRCIDNLAFGGENS